LVEIPLEDEVSVVRGPVGPRVTEPLVLLPYGAPLVDTLEEKPVDGIEEVTLVTLVGTLRVLLADPDELNEDGEVPVVKGAVGPLVSVPLVLLPYGAPLVETLEERPDDATEEVMLAVLVGILIVLLPGSMILEEDGEVPVVRGAVGPEVSELLVPLPYGAPLVPLLEGDPLETAVVVLFAVLEMTEDETPVGPRETELLVPLPYGAPLEEALEEKPVEAVLEVELAVLVTAETVLLIDTLTLEKEIPVEIGTVGPTNIPLLVPLPYGAPLEEALEEKPVEAALEVELAVPVETEEVLLALAVENEIPVTIGMVGPTSIPLLVPLP
jgi:hypothetical protein